jgi:hypothetical protein
LKSAGASGTAHEAPPPVPAESRPLDVADGLEVRVELRAILGADAALEALVVGLHRVEHALAAAQDPGRVLGRPWCRRR